MRRNKASLRPEREQRAGDGNLRNLVRSKEGLISSRIFNDPEIHRLEMDRIFTRSWLYVAHESEIPLPGDFVTRYMGGDPVIVWRGQDGKVRVFLNVCRHRGRTVCAEDMGKASHFKCPYHGWTYNNGGELISVPFFEGYQGKLDKGGLGLYPTYGVESYQGLIFASWSDEAGSFSDYLGEMKWILDLLFGRTDGMEVVGPPMRWEADANWKLAAANFAGDGTHIPVTHGFLKALNLGAMRSPDIKNYRLVMDNGNAVVLTYWPSKDKDPHYLALPRELWPEIERQLTEEQLELMRHLVGSVGNLFPNLSFLTVSKHLPEEWGGPEGQLIPFLTLRQWQPKGADKMEVWSWCFVDKNGPELWKEASKQCYLRTFGMAGMFEQDDMENWGEITQSLRGPVARRLWLQYQMGMKVTPAMGWKGEGTAYSPALPVDFNERAFYGQWQRLMNRA